MEESDTYLMIVEEGEAICARDIIVSVSEERFGPAQESFRQQLAAITDVARLKRMVRRAVNAASWQEILDTP